MSFKIYTKTGDDGSTGLVGGNRIRKSDVRLEAYGTVDELNSWLGLTRSAMGDNPDSEFLLNIQHNLMVVGSKLASDEKGKQITDKLNLPQGEIENLERTIDLFESGLKPLKNFILPGGTTPAAYCHIARTVCRRAERRIVQLSEVAFVDKDILIYLNRLSDFLFVLSRKIMSDGNAEEIEWNKKS